MSESNTPQLSTAICRLYLRDEHWLPLGLDAVLKADHRSAVGGPIVQAYLVALIDDQGRVGGWIQASFTSLRVDEAGVVEELDLQSAADAVSTYGGDGLPDGSGVHSLAKERLARNAYSQNWKGPESLKQQAYQRAELQIKDKVVGGRAVGVSIRKIANPPNASRR